MCFFPASASGFLKSNSMVPTLAVISAFVNFMVPGGLPTADSSIFCTDFLSSEKTDVVISVTINEMLIIFMFNIVYYLYYSEILFVATSLLIPPCIY